MLLRFTSIKNDLKFELISEYSKEFNDEYDSTIHIFKIYEEGKEDFDYFSFILVEVKNSNDLKVVDLYPDCNKYYLGKGISISIILFAKTYFNKRIISSSNKQKLYSYTEFNTDSAIKKVWLKLVNLDMAKYCETKDFFYTT